MELMTEKNINIVAEGTQLEGTISLGSMSRIYGRLAGKIIGTDGTTLIFCESSYVDGTIEADTLIIDGYIKGEITAKTKVLISRTGRVIGNIKTKSLQIEAGAHFDGKCETDQSPLV